MNRKNRYLEEAMSSRTPIRDPESKQPSGRKSIFWYTCVLVFLHSWFRLDKNGNVLDNFGVFLEHFGYVLDKFGAVSTQFGSTNNPKNRIFTPKMNIDPDF